MILGLVNQKGGVGKSTIAVHLAVWLQEQGAKVAMVDADSQSSSTEWVRTAQPDIPCYRWRSSEEILSNVPKLQAEVEVVVMDGPAGLNEATRTIMMLADGILIPCGPSALDLRAVEDAFSVVKAVQETRKGGLPLARLVPNKLQRRYRLSKELINVVGDMEVVGSSGLGLRQAYADAPGQGTVVWRMGSAARDAAAEIDQLFKEVLADEDTFENERNSNQTQENPAVLVGA